MPEFKLVTRDQLDVTLASFFGKFQHYFDNRLKEEIKPLNKKIDDVLDILSGLVKRMDDDDVERSAMTAQLNRHEGWINELASNTGTQLSPP